MDPNQLVPEEYRQHGSKKSMGERNNALLEKFFQEADSTERFKVETFLADLLSLVSSQNFDRDAVLESTSFRLLSAETQEVIRSRFDELIAEAKKELNL